MPKSILPAALLSLALAPLLVGQTPPRKPGDFSPGEAPPADRPVEKLVEQLGDSDFRKRDEAVRRLQARGQGALPALRKALGHRDPEVRRRALDLIPALETAALLAPKRVTLKVADKPLRDVLAEVTRQTGYPIDYWGGTDQVYSFDFKDATFWEALDRINSVAGLGLQQGYGDDRVRLQQQGGRPRFVRRDGAFRFQANTFQLYRNIDLSQEGQGGQRSETLTFTFTVFAEPKLPLLGLGEPKVTAAYDTEKNSMLVPGTSNPESGETPWGGRGRVWSRYGNGNRCLSMQTQVNLNRVSEKATGVKLLRGTIPVTLLVKQEPVVVTDDVLKSKGKKVKVGTTDFNFEDITLLPSKQYQLKLSVLEENKDNPNDYTWMNTLYQRIELVDDRGGKYQVWGSSWGNSGPNHVQMTLTYGQAGGSKLGPPSKFIFHAWTTLHHQLPFEFRDLPLP